MRTQEQTPSPATVIPHGLEIDGRFIAVDDDGYLLDSRDWTPQVAETMAANDELTLSDDHWIAIHFLRDFYAEFGIAPELDLMQRTLCKSQKDCRWNRKFLRQMFPVNGARDACRYAGLPKPPPGACG